MVDPIEVLTDIVRLLGGLPSLYEDREPAEQEALELYWRMYPYAGMVWAAPFFRELDERIAVMERARELIAEWEDHL